RANLRHEKTRTIKDRKDARPKGRREPNNVLVSFFHHRVEPRGGKFEQVKEFSLCRLAGKFERIANTAGGGIMTVAEAGAQDQDAFHQSPSASSPASTGQAA